MEDIARLVSVTQSQIELNYEEEGNSVLQTVNRRKNEGNFLLFALSRKKNTFQTECNTFGCVCTSLQRLMHTDIHLRQSNAAALTREK